jgi:hypothetical protein
MTPSFGTVFSILIIVGGIYWCADVFGRFRKDLATLRESDEPAERIAVIFWWAVTAFVFVYMCFVMWRVWGRIYETFRHS